MKRHQDVTASGFVSSSCDGPRAAKVHRALLATASSCPKVGIARILLALHKEGLLDEGLVPRADENAVRKSIGKSAAELAVAVTPFGPLVQSIDLPTTPAFKWDFIHPMALVFYLSTVSISFSKLMESVCTGMMNIVINMDEAKPGNPLRPDHGRATNNIFWVFSEFPEWLLRREFAWFTFGTLRSTIVDKLVGGVSELMKIILHVFWSPSSHNFQSGGGLFRRVSGEHTIVKATLEGFLADELGLKEIYGTKSSGGTKPCIGCKNVVRFLDDEIAGHPYLVGIGCCQPHRFDICTDTEVYDLVDRLQAASRGPRKALEVLEQTSGLNYIGTGLLFDAHCRSFVRPVAMKLTDWMHTYVSGGVAAIELEQIVHKLRQHGVSYTSLTEYFEKFTLPTAYGRVNPDWFTTKRLGRPGEDKDGWRGFASEVLTIVPILLSFLELAVLPMGVLERHIECFRLLDALLKLLSLGAEQAHRHLATIENVMHRHATMFADLYGSKIKPKFHYQFHIPGHIRSVGKLLSCFVTERKHRSVKHIATHAFRNFETVVTRDLLCGIVDRAGGDCNLYSPEHLVSPSTLHTGPQASFRSVCAESQGDLFFATGAELLCGSIRKGDVVMFRGGIVGQVSRFVQHSDNDGQSIWVLFSRFDHVDGQLYRKPALAVNVAEPSLNILGALAWCWHENLIRVLLPRQSAIDGGCGAA